MVTTFFAFQYLYLDMKLITILSCAFIALVLSLRPGAKPVVNSTSEERANTGLLLIEEDGLYGYINLSGQAVIPCQFKRAQQFFENLAAARRDEHYGYIDTTGAWAIPPTYDYAAPFYRGCAVVYEDSLPRLIDREGTVLTTGAWANITRFEPFDFFHVETKSGKQGLIDQRGSIVIDTLPGSTFTVGDNIILQTITNAGESTSSDSTYHVYYDHHGKRLPLERFKHQKMRFSDGIGDATIYHKEDDVTTFVNHYWINTQGKVIGRLPACANVGGEFHRNHFFVWLDSVAYRHHFGENIPASRWGAFLGLASTRGEIICFDPTWESAGYWDEGLCFVEDSTLHNQLVNLAGETLLTGIEMVVIKPDEPRGYFVNDRAVIRKEMEWLVIDRAGVTLDTLTDELTDWDDAIWMGDQIVVKRFQGDLGGWIKLIDLKGRTVIEVPGYRIMETSTPGVFITSSYEGVAYFKKSGAMIWQGAQPVSPDQCTDVDHKISPTFSATTFDSISAQKQGYWYGGVDRAYYPLSDQPRKQGVFLTTSHLTEEQASGNVIYTLANRTSDTIFFEAQDSRLEVSLQGQLPGQEWRSISRPQDSFCGSSYHQIYLPPGTAWDFELSPFEGGIESSVRPVLEYSLDRHPSESFTIIGESMPCGLNPGQFWRLPNQFDYYPLLPGRGLRH